jgi:hypothetical protein
LIYRGTGIGGSSSIHFIKIGTGIRIQSRGSTPLLMAQVPHLPLAPHGQGRHIGHRRNHHQVRRARPHPSRHR